MKTSLKQLGHFSEVLCGKGFWGHVVCVFIHLYECVYGVLTLQGMGGVITSPPPFFHSPLIRSHYSLWMRETTHTFKQPTTPLMWCGQSQSQTAVLHCFIYLSKRKSGLFFFLFLTNRVQICIHSHKSFSDPFHKQVLTQIQQYHH